MIHPNQSLPLRCGLELSNRFMLAPMTNHQSHDDGQLSDEEYTWLLMRARGGFAITLTCASHVHRGGQGFPGQLGIFSDELLSGHQRLTRGIAQEGSLAAIQLIMVVPSPTKVYRSGTGLSFRGSRNGCARC